MDLQARAGPMVYGDGDRLRDSGADGVKHARVAKRRRIAPLLQVETVHVYAAGGVDRQHELEVDLILRPRRARAREQGRERACRNGSACWILMTGMGVRALAHVVRPRGGLMKG